MTKGQGVRAFEKQDLCWNKKLEAGWWWLHALGKQSWQSLYVSIAQTEDLIKALQDLENAASGDATVRQKIASLPQEVQDVSLLEKITGEALKCQHLDAKGRTRLCSCTWKLPNETSLFLRVSFTLRCQKTNMNLPFPFLFCSNVAWTLLGHMPSPACCCLCGMSI